MALKREKAWQLYKSALSAMNLYPLEPVVFAFDTQGKQNNEDRNSPHVIQQRRM